MPGSGVFSFGKPIFQYFIYFIPAIDADNINGNIFFFDNIGQPISNRS